MTVDQTKLTRCDRYWLMTSTTYGNWLPGDARGFVSNVERDDGVYSRRNEPGQPFDSDDRLMLRHARQRLRGSPVRFSARHADLLLTQFLATAAYRSWELIAAAIMSNHVHLVIGVIGDPEPWTLLRDFKSYGSRCLNRQFPLPKSRSWWTKSGSVRKLDDDRAVLTAVNYLLQQEFPLRIWTGCIPELNLEGGLVFPASGGRESSGCGDHVE